MPVDGHKKRGHDSDSEASEERRHKREKKDKKEKVLGE